MIFDKCVEILADILAIDAAEITMDSDLVNGLGADSLDVVQMLTAVEDEFGFTISDEEIVNIKTVGDVVKLIENK